MPNTGSLLRSSLWMERAIYEGAEELGDLYQLADEALVTASRQSRGNATVVVQERAVRRQVGSMTSNN